MAKRENRDFTATELNAIIYRYLLESGFIHSGFNFFYEAGIGKTDIQGMNIPHGALIRVVHKGLQYIELEANSEMHNDDESSYHIFDALDLITNDSDELKRKIVSSMKVGSSENDKEQKTNSFKTDKEQKIDSEKAQEIEATGQNIIASETAQKTAKTAQKTAMTAQKTSKTAQKTAKTAQKTSKIAQKTAKTATGGKWKFERAETIKLRRRKQ